MASSGSSAMSEYCFESVPKLERNEDMTFSDFTERYYLPYARQTKRSWKTDERHLRHHILPHLGAYGLRDISDIVLTQWIETLQICGLHPNSCHRLLSIVKYILNCACHWGVLADNGKFKQFHIRRVQSKPEILTTTEALNLIRLLEEKPDYPPYVFIHLLLLTGASRSELTHARWEDLDLKRRILTTDKTFTGRPRLIPLNQKAVTLIQRLPRREGIPWLVSSPRGKQMLGVWKDWNNLRTQIGRPTLRLQDLRHTFASFLMSIGISESDLKSILGHYQPGQLSLLRDSCDT